MLSLGLLFGCERPDPKGVVIQAPVETETPLPTSTALPTQPPIQVYVVVATPTPDPTQSAKFQRPVSAAVKKPEIVVASLSHITSKMKPTPIPANYFQGWAWSNSLIDDRGRVSVGISGLTLRDRPAQDGRVVGVVFGLVDVSIVGREQCGYTPILVHADNMITKTTPHLEILPPEPLPTEPPLFTPIPISTARFSKGWAYTDGLTLLGQTAISGPVGINLRSDPCLTATNLGFVPAGSTMIITGPPSKEYTAVQVSNDLLQPPFDLSEISSPNEYELLASQPEHLLPTGSPMTGNSLESSPTTSSPSPTPAMMTAPITPNN